MAKFGDFLKSVFSNVAGPLVGGLASFASGSMSAKEQRELVDRQIQAQSDENRRNREYNLMLARLQNDWNVSQWQRENDYNSPSNMVARLRQAGLNPNLALSGGVLSGLRAASSPEMTAGAPSSPVDMSAISGVRTFGEAQQRAIDTALAVSAARKNSADASLARQKRETEVYGTDVMKSKARFADALNSGAVRLQDVEIQLKGSSKRLTDEQVDQVYYETKYLQQQIEESQSRIQENLAQVALLDEKTKSEIVNRVLNTREVQARIDSLAASTEYTRAQILDMVMTRPLRIMNLRRDAILKGWQGIETRSRSRINDITGDKLQLEYDVDSSMKDWRMAIERSRDIVDLGTDISYEVRQWYNSYMDKLPTEETVRESQATDPFDGTKYRSRSTTRSRKK